ncbi:MAG: Crp/Fnr family transcriptional regulator [Clostridiales bacterium]|nr:Crp/Fnr family transcriptional regulator [Clostridiales bacterium]
MLEKEDLMFISSHLSFWDRLTQAEKELLEQQMMKTSYPKGFNLHNSADECLGILLIRKGGLRVYILSEDGREVTLYRLSEGEVCVMSASCVLNSITFDVHIDAESDTEVYLIRSGIFRTLKDENVYVENFVYKNAVDRFSDVMWAMEQILFMSVDKRLAIFLLDEMRKNHSHNLYLTQEQIARYIGSAREVVSRMLKSFQADGLIEQSRGIIKIVDKERLSKLVP